MKQIMNILLALVISTIGGCVIASALDINVYATIGTLTAFSILMPNNVMLTTLCGKITKGQAVICDEPLQGGSKDRLILINFDDIDVVTEDVNNPILITNIILASGAVAYEYEGKNNSILPKSALVKQRFAEVYDHEVNFKVFYFSADEKKELEALAKGRVAAITENNYKGTDGETAFEVLGISAGLIVTALERDPNSTDTQGAFDVTLKTSETAKEAHLPSSLFDTDYTTTKAIVDGLL